MIETLHKYLSSQPPKPAELRMSAAGDCPRKLELDYIRGTGEVKPQQILRMESGHYLHKMLQDLFSKAFGSDFKGQEEEVSLMTPGGLTILGHVDGYLESKSTVIDFKSVSGATYAMIDNDNKPLDANIAQNNLYGIAKGMEWQALIYFNRENCTMRSFVCETSPTLAALTLEMFDSVKANWEAGQSRPRPYHDKSESPCFFCNHKDICYQDFSQEVSGRKTLKLDDPNLLEMASTIWAQKKARLQAEKIEEEMRSRLGHALYSTYKVKGAEIGSYLVDLKVGKNDNLITNVKEKKNE